MRPLLALHAIVLLLASTDFTVATALLGKDALRWSYFKYASQSGFGYEYVSAYSGLTVSTYLLAFVLGIAGFCLAIRQDRRVVGALGLVLSIVGLVSFTIEGSHWIFEHNRSWLAFSPALAFALVALACLPKRLAARAASQPATV